MSQSRVDICLLPTEKNLTIQVRDYGPGIDEALIEQLFEPFFTTKVNEGLGLGLSISQRIVEQLNGQLSAANHPGGGAVFSLTLTLANIDTQTANQVGEKF